jgi:protein TonB
MSLKGYLLERHPLENLGPMPRRAARQRYQRYLMIALLIAGGAHLASLIGGMGVRAILGRRADESATRQVKIVPYRDLGAPPSLEKAPAEVPKFGIAPPKIKVPAAAIPIPVPEEQATSTTIASQEQMPFAGTEGDTGLGDTTGLGGVDWGALDGGDIIIEEEVMPSPDDFVFVEEQPVLVESQTPDYPALARQAGIEGTVIVRALVGKDGRVHDTIIGSGVSQILDEAAMNAARRFVFKPAIQNRNPVAVWVAIPFKFSLKES